MSNKVRWTALWSAVAALVTFALIVAGVDRYEAELTKINWPLVSLFSVFVFASAMLYRWNDQLARYNLIELVMNPKTGKPDPYRHLLWVFAGLTVWSITQVVLAKQWGQLSGLLLPALGFFVAKPAIDGVADAWASRPAQSGNSGGGGDQVNIVAPNADTVTTQPQPAEAATEVIAKAKARKR